MMRTKTLALTALVFLISSCGNKTSNKIEQDKQHTGWDDYGLKGEVKSLREIQYKAVDKFGKIQKGDIDDSYSFKSVRVYFSLLFKNLLLGDILDSIDDFLPFKSGNVYILFNNKGNRVELNMYKSDGSLGGNSMYKYDNKGNQVEKNRYKSNGSLDEKYTYKYDNKGNRVEVNNYKSDGRLDFKWTYKYDNKGNRVEVNNYKSDGSLKWKHTYKYDNKGNQVEKNEYDWYGSLLMLIKVTYKYDNKGNLVEENSYMSNGSLDYQHTYTYTYDKKGNWNKKITFKNTIPQTIIEREIVYF